MFSSILNCIPKTGNLSGLRAAWSHQLMLKTRNYSCSVQEASKAVELSNRGVLRLSGRDTLIFLQGLITNDTKLLERGGVQSMYAAFLNPQGRFLYDAFLYPQPASTSDDSAVLLADVDAGCISELVHHLKKFRLRARVDISDVSDEYKVWSQLGPEVQELIPTTGWIRDPRLADLGLRSVFLDNEPPCSVSAACTSLPSDSTLAPSTGGDCEHFKHRVGLGVAEGSVEIPAGEALPLEYNLQGLGGISLKKGCYVGQELTARTHFRGVIRKRLMPVNILPSLVPPVGHVSSTVSFDSTGVVPGNNIVDVKGKKVGRLNAVTQDLQRGFALVRLKQALSDDEELYMESSRDIVKPYRPSWWPQEWGKEEE